MWSFNAASGMLSYSRSLPCRCRPLPGCCSRPWVAWARSAAVASLLDQRALLRIGEMTAASRHSPIRALVSLSIVTFRFHGELVMKISLKVAVAGALAAGWRQCAWPRRRRLDIQAAASQRHVGDAVRQRAPPPLTTRWKTCSRSTTSNVPASVVPEHYGHLLLQVHLGL